MIKMLRGSLLPCLLVSLIFQLTDSQKDYIVTEVFSNEMLDLDFEEMAAMDDDVLHRDFNKMLMTEPTLPEPTCMSGKSELLFLFDGSDQVTGNDFNYLLDWLNDLVESYDLMKESDVDFNDTKKVLEKTRLALIQFAEDPKIELGLGNYLSRLAVRDAIDSVTRIGGVNYGGRSLDIIRTMVFDDESVRSGARKIVVFVTSGSSQDNITSAASKLKESGVSLFVVSIGNDKSNKVLEEAASQPKQKFYYQVDDYEHLESIRKKLKWKICQETKPNKHPKNGSGKLKTKSCTCQDGKPGKQGPKGASGFKGDRGIKGNLGKSGIRGKVGPAGKRGLVGLPGPPGPPGPSGPSLNRKGDSGGDDVSENNLVKLNLNERFVTGELDVILDELKGNKGEPGEIGLPGPEGPRGPQGAEGAEGMRGLAGVQGPMGPVGPAGEMGLAGLRGPIGPLGRPGPPGPKGATGGGSGSVEEMEEIATRICSAMIKDLEKRTSGSNNVRSNRLSQSQLRSLRGPPGPAGSRGYSGPPGPQGYEGAAGPRGYPGTMGLKGSRGDKGSIGDKGERGPSGIGIQGSAGIPGPPGSPGRSRTGSPGAVGPLGEMGPRGTRGYKGAVGKTGAPGKCSNKQCSSFRRLRRSTRNGIDNHGRHLADNNGDVSSSAWWPWQ